MTQQRDAEILLRDMVAYAQQGMTLTGGRTRDDLDEDIALALAVPRALSLIGEAARGIPNDMRARYPEIEWRQWVGLRNVLIHAYHRVDLDEAWQICAEELPGLVRRLQHVIEQEFPE